MRTKRLTAAILACLLASTFLSRAQTILSGNISGTWSPSGNPYIISANATVQSGQTLTIQPNVTVWIASGVSITFNGVIQAVGTPSQHITFQPPIDSQFWNSLSVNNTGTNLFSYCDFLNATNALAFDGTSTNEVNYCTFTNVMGSAVAFNNQGSNQVNYCAFTNVIGTALAFNNQSGNQAAFCTFETVSNGIAMMVNANNLLTANIANCSFSNCSGQAVSGVGNGGAGYMWNNNGTILVLMQNCSFSCVAMGCSFNIYGYSPYTFWTGYGYGNVSIQDNLFDNITNTAISLTQNGYAGSSTATVINNIIINASNAIISQDPWDATVMDGIFMGCTNAVMDTGSLSRNVEYNDFYEDATNFIGYTSDYGTIILVNRNGTACDLLFNIFQNPEFVAPANFNLEATSPCIGAGTPNPSYMNVSFPPSQGTNFPDLGIYGGPLARNWLAVVPTSPSPITLSASPALRLTCNNVLAGGTYQILSSPDLTNWSNYGSPFYISATTNLVKYLDVTNGAGFFRLQSLH